MRLLGGFQRVRVSPSPPIPKAKVFGIFSYSLEVNIHKGADMI